MQDCTQGTYVYGVLRDASESHAAETALRDLLLSTSYDLRVNTQNVQAASTLLLAHPAVAADEEAAFLAGAIQSSCNLLLGIVSNVIEMRKLERGELALTPTAFNPAAALRDVLRSCAFGLQRGAAGLRWENEAEADTVLPPRIEVR
jgi:K+-sensing histidine kinase KdpD